MNYQWLVTKTSTTTQFFEEFPSFLQDKITGSGELLMVGDLNFHLDKKADNTTQKFTNMLGSLGIEQHVSKTIHMSGHTLDAILCRDTDNPVQRVQVGDMITDHHLLLRYIHHPKPHLQKTKLQGLFAPLAYCPNLEETLHKGWGILMTGSRSQIFSIIYV